MHMLRTMTGIRLVVILGFLSVLASMALVLVIFGQRQAEARLLQYRAVLIEEETRHTRTVRDRNYMVKVMETEMENAKTTLDTEKMDFITRREPFAHKKRHEAEWCQSDKTKKLDDIEKGPETTKDLLASFKTEKEAWAAEVVQLQEQLNQTSSVCQYVKPDMDTSGNLTTLCPPVTVAPTE